MIELAIVCGLQLALIGYLVWSGRQRDAQTVALIRLIDTMSLRIQAPQNAAVELHNRSGSGPNDPEYAPQALEPDDDVAYWETRDELAARLMREEQIAQQALSDGDHG